MVDIAFVSKKNIRYPDAPFNPSEKFPEIDIRSVDQSQNNEVFKLLRQSFIELKLDLLNVGKSSWNPLGEIINPGDCVLLKPNFVLSKHPKNKDLFSIVTHPSVIRAVAEYCAIALKGKGRIILADTPQYNCNFDELSINLSLKSIKQSIESLYEVPFEINDLRNYWSPKTHHFMYRKKLHGDTRGRYVIDLKELSAFANKKNKNYYGAVYDRNEIKKLHNEINNTYIVSKQILDTDVLISIPKLKVHKKVGVTLNCKGLVGISTNKNSLVHYTLPYKDDDGDQFPPNVLNVREKILIKIERFLYDLLLSRNIKLLDKVNHSIYNLHRIFLRPFKFSVRKSTRILDAGNWKGNDSAWRMTYDLTQIIHFYKGGKFSKSKRIRLFSVIDGIIGGENLGPLEPDSINSNTLISGFDLVNVDFAAAKFMGYQLNEIKYLEHVYKSKVFKNFIKDIDETLVSYLEIDEFDTLHDNQSHTTTLNDFGKTFTFYRHPGWQKDNLLTLTKEILSDDYHTLANIALSRSRLKN